MNGRDSEEGRANCKNPWHYDPTEYQITDTAETKSKTRRLEKEREVVLEKGMAWPPALQSKPLNGASTSTQTNPDGTSVVTETAILANGKTQTTSSSYSSPPSQSLLSSVSSVSDALGRVTQATNGRGHVTNYSYHGPGGQTASITQVNAAPGGGNLVTETSYILTPGSGRRIDTKLPDGTNQYQESDLRGQITRQWGSQTNPVKFTYDNAGRRATLTTYQAAVANVETFPASNGNITTWTYDASGALLSKRDAANQQVNYTYDVAGRVLTRTWARGVVTTYGYTAGQLTSVEYSNDPTNTPAVSIAYDRLGRPVRRANAPLAETLYNYDPATLALDTETVTIDPDGPGSLPALTRILDRDQDTLGRERSTGILPVTNGAAEHSLTYDFDNSGRLSTVTSPAGTFTYSYTPGSSLIASVNTFPLPLGTEPLGEIPEGSKGQGEGAQLTVTNTLEPNRDVLDVKDNRIPSTNTTISSFNYGVNSIGQRTGVTTSGTAFPSQPANWTWGYDALGQVKSADSPTNTHDRAYEYDQIGSAPSEAWRLMRGESPRRKPPAVRQDGARASPPIRTESCGNEGRRKLLNDISEA
jgi:YD repeat-containing protein